MTHVIVVGTEEPQDFQIFDNAAALVGTSWNVALVFRETVATPPTVAWLDQATGKVRVSGCENLAVGRYHVRYKITDGAGRDAFAPSVLAADEWVVVAV